MIFIPVPDAVRHAEGCLSATLFYINCSIKKKKKKFEVCCVFFIEMQVDFLVSMFWLKNWETG